MGVKWYKRCAVKHQSAEPNLNVLKLHATPPLFLIKLYIYVCIKLNLNKSLSMYHTDKENMDAQKKLCRIMEGMRSSTLTNSSEPCLDNSLYGLCTASKGPL